MEIMTTNEMRVWFQARGVDNGDFMDELLDTHAGMTEDQLSEFYDSVCGSMA